MDDEQIQRAKRVWVTDLQGCPRRKQHRLSGEEGLPSHYDQVRGSIGHQITEQILKGEKIDPNFKELPEAAAEIMIDLQPRIENLRNWLGTTDIDLSEAETEVKIELPLRDGFTLVGTVDVLTPTHIIDIKTGKKRNTKEYRTQLAAYREMMKAVDGVHRETVDVFLGGPVAVEANPFTKKFSVDDSITEFERLIEKNIKYTEDILAGDNVPCKTSFLCVYCRHRHLCRGI